MQQSIELATSSYISTEEIDLIINLALELDKPILVEGPPGTGKTFLAIAAAKALNWHIFRLQCFEGITFEQVIGEFDYKRQLLHIELEKMKGSETLDNIFSEEFFIPRPLYQSYNSNKPNILLIDEIDRSEEEFEAFLLEALGENQITVPEIGTVKKKINNIVFLTSNATRDLSEALRRRCLYLYIDFPSPSREKEIIASHLDKDYNEVLLDTLVYLLSEMRTLDLKKNPSIAEGIDWAKSLISLGIKDLDEKAVKTTLPIILKYQEDIELLHPKITELLRKFKES